MYRAHGFLPGDRQWVVRGNTYSVHGRGTVLVMHLLFWCFVSVGFFAPHCLGSWNYNRSMGRAKWKNRGLATVSHFHASVYLGFRHYRTLRNVGLNYNNTRTKFDQISYKCISYCQYNQSVRKQNLLLSVSLFKILIVCCHTYYTFPSCIKQKLLLLAHKVLRAILPSYMLKQCYEHPLTCELSLTT